VAHAAHGRGVPGGARADLAPSDVDTLRAVEGAGPFGPAERPMGGYVMLPPNLVGTPEGDRWVKLALEHIGALPPKAKKP